MPVPVLRLNRTGYRDEKAAAVRPVRKGFWDFVIRILNQVPMWVAFSIKVCRVLL